MQWREKGNTGSARSHRVSRASIDSSLQWLRFAEGANSKLAITSLARRHLPLNRRLLEQQKSRAVQLRWGRFTGELHACSFHLRLPVITLGVYLLLDGQTWLVIATWEKRGACSSQRASEAFSNSIRTYWRGRDTYWLMKAQFMLFDTKREILLMTEGDTVKVGICVIPHTLLALNKKSLSLLLHFTVIQRWVDCSAVTLHYLTFCFWAPCLKGIWQNLLPSANSGSNCSIWGHSVNLGSISSLTWAQFVSCLVQGCVYCL